MADTKKRPAAVAFGEPQPPPREQSEFGTLLASLTRTDTSIRAASEYMRTHLPHERDLLLDVWQRHLRQLVAIPAWTAPTSQSSVADQPDKLARLYLLNDVMQGALHTPHAAPIKAALSPLLGALFYQLGAAGQEAAKRLLTIWHDRQTWTADELKPLTHQYQMGAMLHQLEQALRQPPPRAEDSLVAMCARQPAASTADLECIRACVAAEEQHLAEVRTRLLELLDQRQAETKRQRLECEQWLAKGTPASKRARVGSPPQDVLGGLPAAQTMRDAATAAPATATLSSCNRSAPNSQPVPPMQLALPQPVTAMQPALQQPVPPMQQPVPLMQQPMQQPVPLVQQPMQQPVTHLPQAVQQPMPVSPPQQRVSPTQQPVSFMPSSGHVPLAAPRPLASRPSQPALPPPPLPEPSIVGTWKALPHPFREPLDLDL